MIAPLLLALLPHLAPPADEDPAPEPARFVRVSLPFRGEPLSLAEVEVFSGGSSVAVGKRARQSNTHGEAAAHLAVDGNVDGDYTRGSVTHTVDGDVAWWEVDLGEELVVDRLVIWNRTDCCGERLANFTVQLFDRRHELLWERVRVPRPMPSVELVPFTPQPPPPAGPTPAERNRFQPRIDEAIDRGVDFLLAQQMWDGSWYQHTGTYPVGATGLGLYTLRKCGLPADHPAVRRARAFVLASEPRETYELGTVLMGLGSLPEPRDPEVVEFMEASLELLLDYQGAKSNDGRKEALWAYPHHVDLTDLSNTQYAALGLRAAAQAGLEVPDKVWKRTAEAVLRYQEDPWVVPDPAAGLAATGEDSTTGELRIAGFPYRTKDRPPTASMTTAGLGILGICQEALGGGDTKLARQLSPAVRHGLGWLTHHFTVRANPGGGSNWLLYYLYGLERVGALHGVELLGHHDWYWEGAKHLVAIQGDNGSWESDYVADTCFALLFLTRATASATSGAGQEQPDELSVSEGEDLDVSWRVLGGHEATFFVSGFSEDVREELATERERGTAVVTGFFVERVEYLVDGRVVAQVEGDRARPWSAERFAARHTFTAAGTHRCEVRVTVASPEVGDDGTDTVVLAGEPLEVAVDAVPDARLLAYPGQAARNLLVGATASATSRRSAGQEAASAVDGQLGTGWLSATDDAIPALTIELPKATKGSVLVLAHPNKSAAARDRYDRATRVRIELRGRKTRTLELEVPQRDEERLVLELEKPLALRGLRIEVLERSTGKVHPGSVGFGEVQWLAER